MPPIVGPRFDALRFDLDAEEEEAGLSDDVGEALAILSDAGIVVLSPRVDVGDEGGADAEEDIYDVWEGEGLDSEASSSVLNRYKSSQQISEQF